MTAPGGGPQRILVIRLSAVGDLVMASPLIGALRTAYPDAHIAWLVQAEFADLLAANNDLNEVIAWPRRRWRQLWRRWHLLALGREVWTFVRELKRRRFNLAIDLQGLLKSGVWARLSGASLRVGLDSREGSGRWMTRVVHSTPGDKHIGAEYRDLARALDLEPEPFPMRVALDPADETFAAEFRRRHHLETGYAVFCPFTTRPQKFWIEPRWPELAGELITRYQLPAVILGGPGDREAGERMSDHTRLINLAGATTLRQAAAIVAGAKLLVGVDTGLTHMGIAFNIPTIALFGSTCPYLDTGRPNTRIIYKHLPCAPCKRRPTCDGAYTCMRDISVADVLTATAALLESP
jgi:heptosyltransferase-1